MQNRPTRRLAALFVFAVVSATPLAFAEELCPAYIPAETWTHALEHRDAQGQLVAQLKACLPADKKLQQEVDDLAVDALEALDTTPAKEQKATADFVMQVLLANAEAGFPSSQHNYATAHNAEPGTLMQRLVPQDYPTFLHWTRKAAAQKEPRALFNLAARLADKAPPAGMKQDLPTAYTLFAWLEHNGAGLPQPAIAFASRTKKEIAKQLGAGEAKKLDGGVGSFDFSRLAVEGK